MQSISEDWGVKHLFHWTFSNQKRQVICRTTGKKIVLKGIDDPEKLKSLHGFKRIIIEEATDLTEEDFREINRRVRGVEGIQIILLLNPISEEHWIKKVFYDEETNGRPNPYLKKTTFIHVNYKNNVNSLGHSFMTEDDIEELENLQYINMNDYRVYVLNQWGKPSVKNPFAENFDYKKHVSNSIKKIHSLPTILIWDFNVNPFVVLCAQQWRDNNGHHVQFYHEFVLDSGSVPKMIDTIKMTLPPEEISRVIITGDAMQQKKEITQEGNRNAYTMIITAFGISKARFMVPKSNPLVRDSRNLLNYILYQHPDYKFSDTMKTTINELMYTECDENGDIIKTSRKDKKQRADGLDCVRYFNNIFLFDFIKNWRQYMNRAA